MKKFRYFKNNESYFNFINKNREKELKYFKCILLENKIKVVYEFI